MIVRCPACGAEASLDVLINHDDASHIMASFAVVGAAGNRVTRYLALFRPDKRRLSFSRVAALLDGLVPAMQAQRIERDGKTHDAPTAAWIAGLDKIMQARDEGKLKLPLKSHGYLYEIVIAEASRAVGASTEMLPAGGLRPTSAGAKSIDALEGRRQK